MRPFPYFQTAVAATLALAVSTAAFAEASQAATFHTLGRAQAFTFEPGAVPESRTDSVPIRFSSGARARLTTRIVVGVDSGRGLSALRSCEGLVFESVAPLSPTVYLATFTTPAEALSAANVLYGTPGIRYAHPDFALELDVRSVDPTTEPLYAAQWHLPRTRVDAAWRMAGTGSPSTVVAVVDVGFEEAHPDLQTAWFTNAREIPGNHVDDDGNGYVDDVHGWNFAINGANLIYGQNPAHGTASAGVVGARANGRGVSGVCPDCTLLPLVVDDYPSTAAAAFRYAKAAGASVVTNSWGYAVGTPRTDVVVEAVQDLARTGRGGKGTTVIFAMSNSRRNDCRGPEPDISALDDVIAVSAVDDTDVRVVPAGYGPCLDIVAPSSENTGRAIVTTDRPGVKGYNRGDAGAADVADLDYTRRFFGTSAAAPQVAGVFGLLYAAHPGLTVEAASAAVLGSADKVSPETAAYDAATGHSLDYGYGRVNAEAALESLR